MLTVVDRYISELDTYVQQNMAAIENRERNEAVRNEIETGNDLKLETQEKLAKLVDEFNNLLEERRYAEAEIVARQANEIAPKEAVTSQMMWQSRFVRNYESSLSLTEQKERSWERAMGDDLDRSSIMNVNDKNPLVFGEAKDWMDLTRTRRASSFREQTRLTPAEMEIERSLSKPVEAKFQGTPLSQVLDALGNMTGVNVHLDAQGLGQEGVTSNTPVDLNLTTPISFKSALNLILFYKDWLKVQTYQLLVNL